MKHTKHQLIAIHDVNLMTDEQMQKQLGLLNTILNEKTGLLEEVEAAKKLAGEHLQESVESLLKVKSEAHELGINDPKLIPVISRAKITSDNWTAINNQYETLTSEILEISNNINLIQNTEMVSPLKDLHASH